MRGFAFIFTILLCTLTAFSATDDYHIRQAKRCTQEAEYYQKKADGHRREAQYYLRKAEGYQKEAAYYTRKGDASRARDYMHRADRAMADYKTQMRYASNADNKAADYLKRAAKLLRK